jgi:murein L,D-transpeptidase YcbB/YkuD
VVADIPAAQIEAIENGVAVTRHAAVAGKPDRPSPDIQSKIVEINFNPFWTVPVSIIRKDLVPKMQAEPDYLTRNHIRIFDAGSNELPPSQVDWNSVEAVNYKFKQDPGDFNSLGSIRINFPSAHGVYKHVLGLKPIPAGADGGLKRALGLASHHILHKYWHRAASAWPSPPDMVLARAASDRHT